MIEKEKMPPASPIVGRGRGRARGYANVGSRPAPDSDMTTFSTQNRDRLFDPPVPKLRLVSKLLSSG